MANTQVYLDLLIKEHKDKSKFVSTVAAALTPFVDGLNTLDQIEGGFDLPTATGERLDYLGQWVGVSRDLDYPDPTVYFSLDAVGDGVTYLDLGDGNLLSFGSGELNVETGSLGGSTNKGFDSGVWWNPFGQSPATVGLPDDHYRILIIARIMNNNWRGDVSKAFEIWDTLIPPGSPYKYFIVDNGDLTITIGLTSPFVPIDPLTKSLLLSGKLNVKPAGVNTTYAYIDNTAGALFSFDLSNNDFGGFNSGYWATLT